MTDIEWVGSATAMVKEHTLVVVGSGGVGKSAITVQFLYNQFMTFYDPTIEESYRKQVVIDEVACMLNIVDTAGQEEYATLRDQYWGPGEGFVLVYSITSKETFVEVQDLTKLVLRTKDAATFPMVIVGNKKDLESERKVQSTEGEQLARDLKCPFFETSAKTRLNVDECFTALVREIWKESDDNPGAGTSSKKKKGGCVLL